MATSSSARRRLPWAVAAVLLVGALVLTGRLLGPDGATRAPAGQDPATQAPAATSGTGAPAALPAGAVRVEGVALVPTGAAFRASCQDAADRLRFAVPCPELLPVPSAGPAPAGLCSEENAGCSKGLVWFGMEAFVVPPGFTGAPGSLGALVVLATPDERAAAAMARWCPDQRTAAAPGLGAAAVLAACPAGFSGWSTGSVALRWSRRGTHLTLGLRGQSEANRRLLVALAGGLRLVPPG